MLIGINSQNKRASINVTKSVWDKYDVPVTAAEKLKRKKKSRVFEKNKTKNYHKSPIVPKKSKRKNYDENIEKWIAEHYGLDYNKLATDPYKEDF